MATSYHISPNGPRLCRAKNGQCPYARAGEPHYEAQADAQVAYETKMQQAFGVVESVKKSRTELLRQQTYRDRDSVKAATASFRNRARLVRASAPMQHTVSVLRSLREVSPKLNSTLQRMDAELSSAAYVASQQREARLAHLRAKGSLLMARLEANTGTLSGQMADQHYELRTVAKQGPKHRADRTQGEARHARRAGFGRHARGARRFSDSPLYAQAKRAGSLQQAVVQDQLQLRTARPSTLTVASRGPASYGVKTEPKQAQDLRMLADVRSMRRASVSRGREPNQG